MTEAPETIFLLKSDLAMHHKRGTNVGGLVQPCVGEASTEYRRVDLPPKVKELTWYPIPDGQEIRIGRCGSTSYRVSFRMGSWGYTRQGRSGHVISRIGEDFFIDEKDAMAGADEDHEIRIREGLE